MAYDTPDTATAEAKVAVHKNSFTGQSDRSWGQCEEIVDLTPIKSDSCTGLFVNQTWLSNDCMFNQRAVDGHRHRHEDKHIKKTGDLIYVFRYLSGYSLGQSEEQPYGLHPGMITIRDYSRPFEGVQVAGVTQGIFLWHKFLDYHPEQNTQLRVFAESSAFAQIVHAEFDVFFSMLTDGATQLPAQRLNRFKDCIKLAIQGETAREDIRMQARRALRETICAFIERNLADLKLSTAAILKQFGVSRATLFRMFEMDGGVRNYINHRRLFRAVLQISQNPMTRGEISKASNEWGFSSDANFNRSVRRAFGTRPSSLFEGPLKEYTLSESTRSLWAVHRERLIERGLRELAYNP